MLAEETRQTSRAVAPPLLFPRCHPGLSSCLLAEMVAFVFSRAGSTAWDADEGGADAGGPVGATGGLSRAKRNPKASSGALCPGLPAREFWVASLGCFIWTGVNAGC